MRWNGSENNQKQFSNVRRTSLATLQPFPKKEAHSPKLLVLVLEKEDTKKLENRLPIPVLSIIPKIFENCIEENLLNL